MPFFMSFYSCFQSFFIAGAIAIHHAPEFFPVDLSKIIMLSFLIPFQFFIRQCEPQYFYLFCAHIDKFLAKLIIAETFYFPVHALFCMWRCVIIWPKHHHAWPPPAVNRILRHASLC